MFEWGEGLSSLVYIVPAAFAVFFGVLFCGFLATNWIHRWLEYRYTNGLAAAYLCFELGKEVLSGFAGGPVDVFWALLRAAVFWAGIKLHERYQSVLKAAAVASLGGATLTTVAFTGFMLWAMFQAAAIQKEVAAAREAYAAGRYEEARKLLDRGSKFEDNEAMTLVGKMLMKGQGGPANESAGVQLLAKAAKDGYAEAEFALGMVMVSGPTDASEYEKGATYFTRAAEKGHALAQSNLAYMYESGMGVPRDNIHAYKWYLLSAEAGNRQAASKRDKLAAKPTSADTALAMKGAAEVQASIKANAGKKKKKKK